MKRRPRAITVLALCFGGALVPLAHATAQDAVGLRALQTARALAMRSENDAAVAEFLRASSAARAADDKATVVAGLRGAAELLAVRRPCTDSAVALLRTAAAAADAGDRSAADALVRVLAARGDVAGARSALVAAYSDVPSLGRAITKESMRYLQGQAAIEFAGGHESAALSALQQSLVIAARLHQGDVGDTVAKPSGAVDPVNAWVMYDLGRLRQWARSPGVKNLKSAASILDLVQSAPSAMLDGDDGEPYPVLRMPDRAALAARAKGSVVDLPAPACSAAR